MKKLPLGNLLLLLSDWSGIILVEFIIAFLAVVLFTGIYFIISNVFHLHTFLGDTFFKSIDDIAHFIVVFLVPSIFVLRTASYLVRRKYENLGNGRKLVLILVLSLPVICFWGYFAFTKNSARLIDTPSLVSQNSLPQSSSSLKYASSSPTPVPDATNLYEVTATGNATPSADAFSLPKGLERVLGIPVNEVSQVSIDTRKSGSLINSYSNSTDTYYILLNSGHLDVTKTYSFKFTNDLGYTVNATVKQAEPQLLPYVLDKKYCEVDTDCGIGTSWCGYGSGNYYENIPLAATGCEVQADETGYSYGREIDPNMGCITDIKLSNPKCVANKCVYQSRQISCVEPQPSPHS